HPAATHLSLLNLRACALSAFPYERGATGSHQRRRGDEAGVACGVKEQGSAEAVSSMQAWRVGIIAYGRFGHVYSRRTLTRIPVARIRLQVPHHTETGIPFALLFFCCVAHQTERKATCGKDRLEVASPCQRRRSRLNPDARRFERCHEAINPRIPRNKNARPSTSKRDTSNAACRQKRRSGALGPP